MQSLGYEPKHQVAGVVSERVVDELEVVEVEQQQRDLRAVVVRRVDGFTERVHEHGAVGQAGEGVVHPCLCELLLEHAAFGEVAGDRAVVLDRAVGASVRDDDLRHRHLGAVRHQEIDLAAPHTEAVGGRQRIAQELRSRRLGIDVDGAQAAHLLVVADAEQRARGGVGIGEEALRVDHRHEIGRRFEDLGIAPQLTDRVRLVGDVDGRADPALDLAVDAEHRLRVDVHPAQLSVDTTTNAEGHVHVAMSRGRCHPGVFDECAVVFVHEEHARAARCGRRVAGDLDELLVDVDPLAARADVEDPGRDGVGQLPQLCLRGLEAGHPGCGAPAADLGSCEQAQQDAIGRDCERKRDHGHVQAFSSLGRRWSGWQCGGQPGKTGCVPRVPPA